MAAKAEYDWRPGFLTRMAILLICAFIGAGTNLSIAASHKIEDQDGEHYEPITANLANEGIKFTIGALCWIAQTGCSTKTMCEQLSEVRFLDVLKFAVPGFLYMFDNNLIFYIIALVDPPTVSILWNIKILITAVLFRITFNRRFTRQKWVAVFLLLIGCITSQADKLNHAEEKACITVPALLCALPTPSADHALPSNPPAFCPAVPPAPTPNNNFAPVKLPVAPATAECLRDFVCEAVENATANSVQPSYRHSNSSSSGGKHQHKHKIHHAVVSIVDDPSVHHKHLVASASAKPTSTVKDPVAKFVMGMLLILLGTTVTSLAGVYSEWVLKSTKKLPFFLQNMQMNFWGVFFNGGALFVVPSVRAKMQSTGFFYGWNFWTVSTVLCLASFGLLTAAVFKYLDNITNVYKNATTMFITIWFSAVFLGFKPALSFMMGFLVCCMSLLMYNVTPEWLCDVKTVPAEDGSGGTDSKNGGSPPSKHDEDEDENEDEDEEGALLKGHEDELSIELTEVAEVDESVESD